MKYQMNGHYYIYEWHNNPAVCYEVDHFVRILFAQHSLNNNKRNICKASICLHITLMSELCSKRSNVIL